MDFVQDMTEFIFVEDKPQKADMIFIPGGDRGELAVTAAGGRAMRPWSFRRAGTASPWGAA